MSERLITNILCPLLVLGVVLGSGCSQHKEVEHLAIVGAMTYDKVTENGQDKYQVSALIYKPLEMGDGKGGGSKSDPPYLVTSALGISLIDAQKKLRTYSSRYMLYSHTEVIIVGERLMREDGIEKFLDLTARSRNIRLRTFLFVAKGEAVDILAVKPWQEPTISQEIVKFIERQKTESTGYVPDLKEFIQYSLSPRRDPLLGKIQIRTVPDKLLVGMEKGTEMLNLTGASAVSKNRFAGWLNDEEVKGFLFIVNQFEHGTITVQLPSKQQESLSCQIIQAKTSIQPQIEDEELSVFLEVEVDLKVVDIEGEAPISNQIETEELNELITKDIQRIMESSIQKSQELRSDIFGFGETVHEKYPAAWKEIEDDWREIYPDLPINVNVEAKIRQPGIISSPVEVK